MASILTGSQDFANIRLNSNYSNLNYTRWLSLTLFFIKGMEKLGFMRTFKLIDEKIGVRAVSTDRHSQIKKLMKTNKEYNHIIHQFDPLHSTKNISKKLTK